MYLLCSAGLHQPEGLPRWNKGYYFSRCRRCRRDLVRSAGGAWFVPQGYRVVWLAEPPAWAEPARLVAAGMPSPRPGWAERIGAAGRANLERWRAASAGDRATVLPISDVLRELDARRDWDESGASPDEAPISDDFGQGNAEANALAEGAAGGEMVTEGAAPGDDGPPVADAPPAPDAGDGADAPGEGIDAELPVDERSPQEAPSAAIGDEGVPAAAEGSPIGLAGRWALIAVGLLILAIIALIVIATLSSDVDRAKPSAQPAQALATPETAFVNARIVNCRASPVDRAASVRKLARGASVAVLAREDGWTSVSHRSRQCWIASRYLSHEAPL
jgi:hypothetical protein